VPLDHKVLPVHKGYKALPDRQAHLGRRAPKALLAHKGHRENRGYKVHRGRKAPLGQTGLLVPKDPKEVRDLRDLKVSLGHKVLPAHRDRKDRRGRKVTPAHRALRELEWLLRTQRTPLLAIRHLLTIQEQATRPLASSRS
jgi:hypothetical protein